MSNEIAKMQSQTWLDFYEGAWAARAKLLQDFLTKNQDDPFRALQKFRHLEDTTQLSLDASTGTYEYMPQLQHGSKAHLLPNGATAFKQMGIGERIVTVPRYNSVVHFLLSYLQRNSFDAIVELGAGFGHNLIDLFHLGGPRGTPYYAGEVTKSGRELAAFLAERIEGMRFLPFAFDHTAPELLPIVETKNILVFTSHSLEQVTTVPDSFFETIARHANKVTAFNFEPFGFQLANRPEFEESIEDGEVSKVQRAHFEKHQWNLNFVDALLRAHQRGIIKIQSIHKNVIYGDQMSPTSMAYWTN